MFPSCVKLDKTAKPPHYPVDATKSELIYIRIITSETFRLWSSKITTDLQMLEELGATEIGVYFLCRYY